MWTTRHPGRCRRHTQRPSNASNALTALDGVGLAKKGQNQPKSTKTKHRCSMKSNEARVTPQQHQRRTSALREDLSRLANERAYKP